MHPAHGFGVCDIPNPLIPGPEEYPHSGQVAAFAFGGRIDGGCALKGCAPAGGVLEKPERLVVSEKMVVGGTSNRASAASFPGPLEP
jgi:hypothetical protein